MNAYPTCADWTDLDKEIERVSKEVMEDINQMIFLFKRIESVKEYSSQSSLRYGNVQWAVEFNKLRMQMLLNYTRQYTTLQYKTYPLVNLASYRRQNYYLNHHVDPSIL